MFQVLFYLFTLYGLWTFVSKVYLFFQHPNVKKYFHSFKRVKSTKHFKEIRIKE